MNFKALKSLRFIFKIILYIVKNVNFMVICIFEHIITDILNVCTSVF